MSAMWETLGHVATVLLLETVRRALDSEAWASGEEEGERVKDYAVELFCGCFGGTAGFIELGVPVVGFDLEHLPHHGTVPKGVDLVLQDVTTLHGSQFKDACFIWASPPCTEFSYMAMPWSRGKQIEAALREHGEFPERYTGSRTVAELTAPFDACFRIQREACEAAGRYIPLIVENVRGAQKWVGRSRWHYGSFHLWGDVPALMPIARFKKRNIQTWSDFGKPGYRAEAFNGATKGIPHKPTGHWTNPAENGTETQAQKFRDNQSSINTNDGVKFHISGHDWYGQGQGAVSSKSKSRKAASAQIAKIPFPLSAHIARCYKPETSCAANLARVT